jgi:hypothetical protein
MAEVVRIGITDWSGGRASESMQRDALQALEAGKVIVFPDLGFPAHEIEHLIGVDTGFANAKNISFDIATGKLGGIEEGFAEKQSLACVMTRYATLARALIIDLFPLYAAALRTGRTSFRPAEIASRKTSWRKDDSRLHIDSFPATPVQGERILRVFTNVNPAGEPRAWRTGEQFEKVAFRFLPSLPAPVPGSGALLRWLGVTRSLRTPYDHFMLKLHDAMKADKAYQSQVEQAAFDFSAGSSWLVYTDQVSHAAMKGRWAFEQTFYLPVEAMADASTSPLRTLERIMDRPLV